MRSVSTFIAEPPKPTIKTTLSTWHSPAPYLFAGLAAMLGLIAFALLILACSYWKSAGERSGEITRAGDDAGAGEKLKVSPIFEEKIVVIMAGDLNPSYLAMPITIGDENGSKVEKKLEMESEESGDEKLKEEVIMEVREQIDEELQDS
ncbi:protein GLUTAMINE DUMPER 5-like [Lycium barbarum]|uniref:protein GLUTAMINE DUMPER 5-like n=1 Tax=Lycium barbarum TaxID=112863 RepID=UPI00293EDDE3|nr:protein GLUTAMINE DUMPER 5-like [Lycium barbarum]